MRPRRALAAIRAAASRRLEWLRPHWPAAWLLVALAVWGYGYPDIAVVFAAASVFIIGVARARRPTPPSARPAPEPAPDPGPGPCSVATPDPSTVHTYPVGDLIEHELVGDDCPCGPTVEPVHRADGTIGWHILHHSLDGRERHEPPVPPLPPFPEIP